MGVLQTKQVCIEKEDESDEENQNLMKIEDKKKYGWRVDLPDHRDIYYETKNKLLSTKIDMRDKCPMIYDQGNLGSCTANAIGFAFQFDEMKEKSGSEFRPSRLFIYYNERNMEGTTGYDAGASIRDGIKSVFSIGVCDETLWKYDISKFTEKPPEECYTFAKKHESIKYMRVKQSLKDMKECLMEGYPFVFGASIYESFESDKVKEDGMVPMPKKTEQLLGGHALSVVGYNDDYGFLVRNSWGTEWGLEGYCYMPYEYLCNTNLVNDLWTIRRVMI